jgi:hypothetical protein
MESARSHPFFERLRSETIDEKNIETFVGLAGLKILFLWGNNCPNCDIAKNVLMDHFVELNEFSFRWADCNVYENMEVGKRYGLHGIPVFLFLNDSKVLGKVSPFPGWIYFQEALKKVQSQYIAD